MIKENKTTITSPNMGLIIRKRTDIIIQKERETEREKVNVITGHSNRLYYMVQL